MPDISMCMDDDKCPLAPTCYRSERSGTKPNEYRQSYSQFYEHGRKDENGRCVEYWPNPYVAATGDDNG